MRFHHVWNALYRTNRIHLRTQFGIYKNERLGYHEQLGWNTRIKSYAREPYFAADRAPQASQTMVVSCFSFSRCVSGLLHTGQITLSFKYRCNRAENECLSGRPMKIALPFSIEALIAS